MPSQRTIDSELLLRAYANGVFPMARSRDGDVDWYCPDPRAVLPLNGFRVTRSLNRRVRRGCYAVTADRAFERVMRRCAEPRGYTDDTWINEPMVRAYTELHNVGFAHSVEAWAQNDDIETSTLVGGLYGVSIGGAFFGESMFSRATDASKVCLVHLVNHLRARGYALLDVQLPSAHMSRFGTVQVPRERFLEQLGDALGRPATWGAFDATTPPPARRPAERSAP